MRKIATAVGRGKPTSSEAEEFPRDFDDLTIRIVEAVQDYTMTNRESVATLVQAVKHVVQHDIAGSIVECGVWKGGSMMAVALTLKEMGDESRDLYLYDTFAGMSAPSAVDDGVDAKKKFDRRRISEEASNWCLSPIDETRENLLSTGYPIENIHFVKGKVEDTIPATVPGDGIALLRLDTDWYASTKHELTHLFPLLSKNGPIIVDDYGHWKGQRKAVDEYLAENNLGMFLSRIDYNGRIGIKPE